MRLTSSDLRDVLANGATLTESLERSAHIASPDARFGFFDRRSGNMRWRTHSELLRRSADAARRYVESDITVGTRVIIACREQEQIITAFLAAVLNGALPLIHPIRSAFDKRAKIVSSLHERAISLGSHNVVVVHEVDDPIGPDIARHVRTFALENDLSSAHAFTVNYAPKSEDPFHLQGTSGTTGIGKSTLLTNANVVANIASLIDRMEVQPNDRTVSWIPLYHDMGLISSVLLPLATGTVSVLESPFDFLADPISYLRLVSDTRGTINMLPAFGLDQIVRRAATADLAGLDLSEWRLLYTGTEMVDMRTLRRFYGALKQYGLPITTLKSAYGMAEATLMITMQGPEEQARFIRTKRTDITGLGTIHVSIEGQLSDDVPELAIDQVDIVSAGRAGADMELWLIDDRGERIVSDDVCGEAVIAGSSVSPGYLDSEGLTANPPTGFRTGDIAFFHGGDIYIVERAKNIIIRNGENYSAQMIEQQLALALDRTLDEVVVLDSNLQAGAGRVTAVIGVGRNEELPPIETQIRACQDALPLPIDEIIFCPRGALPKTTSGKKQHMRLRQMLADDELTSLDRVLLTPTPAPALAAPTPPAQDVIDLVALDPTTHAREEIDRVARRQGLEREVLDTDHLAHTLGFDSLTRIELVAAIEDRTGVRLDEDEVGTVTTVGELLAAVRQGATRVGDADQPQSMTQRVQAIFDSIPQSQCVVEQQADRQLLIDGRWISDFASLNYLGLDLEPEVIRSVEPMLARWGTHPSWTRAVASPLPYRELERGLASLVGAPDTVVFATVTLLHFGVLPKLAGPRGVILIDEGAHMSIVEAAQLAQQRGARVLRVRRSDPSDLEAKLRQTNAPGRTIVAVNGVYSMTGNIPALREYAELAEKYDALLYVDDAHGVGVLGHNPSPARPYGIGGSGVVRHLGLSYDRILYVGGLSKAFSSMAAFITCRDERDRAMAQTASTMVFSGPIPVASLATAIAGLQVNERDGDRRRDHLHRLTKRIIDGALDLGFIVDNDSGFPCVTIICGSIDNTVFAHEILWKHRLLVTPAVFPAMPVDRGGVRVSVTASNTDAEVDQLLTALAELRALITIPEDLRLSGTRFGTVDL